MAGQIVHPHRWRLYFNSRQAAPLVCSLDNGDTGTEFSVRQAFLHDIKHVSTSYMPHGALNPSDPARIPYRDEQPIFCVEFEAELKMEFGLAHFYPCDVPKSLQTDYVGMSGLSR